MCCGRCPRHRRVCGWAFTCGSPPARRTSPSREGASSDGAFVERWTIRRPGGLRRHRGGHRRAAGQHRRTCSRASSGWTTPRRWPDCCRRRPRFVVEGAGLTAPASRARTSGSASSTSWPASITCCSCSRSLLIVGGRRRLLWTITAFTVAHSLTLAAATLGFVHVPPAPVEAAIALSIVFVAAEIVHGLAAAGRVSPPGRRGWSRSSSACCTASASRARSRRSACRRERSRSRSCSSTSASSSGSSRSSPRCGPRGLAQLARSPGRAWPRRAALRDRRVAMFWVIERVLAFL